MHKFWDGLLKEKDEKGIKLLKITVNCDKPAFGDCAFTTPAIQEWYQQKWGTLPRGTRTWGGIEEQYVIFFTLKDQSVVYNGKEDTDSAPLGFHVNIYCDDKDFRTKCAQCAAAFFRDKKPFKGRPFVSPPDHYWIGWNMQLDEESVREILELVIKFAKTLSKDVKNDRKV